LSAPMDIRLLAAGCVLSLVVAATAYGLRLLTLDGAAAAVAVGTLVFGFGGWRHAGLLVLFFVTSSALTRWQAQRKPHPEHTRGRSGSHYRVQYDVVGDAARRHLAGRVHRDDGGQHPRRDGGRASAVDDQRRGESDRDSDRGPPCGRSRSIVNAARRR